MNKIELCELLEELAKKDLVDGGDIFDHPCTVAVRALNQIFDDVNMLKNVMNKGQGGQSKATQTILGLRYDPSF